MEIGATKAVQDRLKTTKIEESKGASLAFCWDTHLTKIKGRNVLFIVNASNRYTIAMTDIEPRNWNYYTMYIRSVIHGVMQDMGYSEDQIRQYFKMSGDTTVTKTHGRKSVGGINRMVMDAQYFGKKLEKEAKYQWHISSTCAAAIFPSSLGSGSTLCPVASIAPVSCTLICPLTAATAP